MLTIVEFTGITCAGKTTLQDAVKEALDDQGIVARDAYDIILARYGLNLARYLKLRSLLIDLVAFLPFWRYTLTKNGLELLGLAVRVIIRNSGGFLVALNLLRNYAKRIGVHVLLTRSLRQSGKIDFAICDEGTLHIAHNLFVNTDPAPDPSEIVHFANIVPKPDIIIWVKGNKEQSIECILQRGHSRVEASTDAARAFVEHGNLTFSVLCSEDLIQERLFTIDNAFDSATDKSFSIKDRAQTLAAFLQQYRMATKVHA